MWGVSTEPIVYYNRYTQQPEQEKILGERGLRWVYGSTLGQLSLHVLIKRAVFSHLIGALKSSRRSARDLPVFVREYGINTEEMLLPPESYTSFNEFFIRKLKPGARPVCAGSHTLAMPADGRHSAWQDAAEIRRVFVKGQSFDLPALLGDAQLAERYQHGALLLSRLCPVDYHRFHFPVAGTPTAPRRIPGPLASVSPYSLRRHLAWLWTNKREITLLHTEHVGDIAIIAVGATGVGAIHQTYTPEQPVQKGDEQGYFSFGGSTIITLFEPQRIRFADDLLEQTARGYELYARQGDILGETGTSED